MAVPNQEEDDMNNGMHNIVRQNSFSNGTAFFSGILQVYIAIFD